MNENYRNFSFFCTSSCPYYKLYTKEKHRTSKSYCDVPRLGKKSIHEGRPCLHPDILEDILNTKPVNISQTLADIQTLRKSYHTKRLRPD
jgi:hypothetical protein